METVTNSLLENMRCRYRTDIFDWRYAKPGSEKCIEARSAYQLEPFENPKTLIDQSRALFENETISDLCRTCPVFAHALAAVGS